MKCINFTAVEILPALLDKTKEQTIRPAWKKVYFKGKIPSNAEEYTEGKPPRFKVGEKARLYWNQRSKYKLFCSGCGGWVQQNGIMKHYLDCPLVRYSDKRKIFHKILGTVEITEVFKIEIGKRKDKEQIKEHGLFYVCFNKTNREGYEWDFIGLNEKNQEIKDLAKRDGFLSAEEMFRWFDKQHDLSSPRKFHVYRFKWIE